MAESSDRLTSRIIFPVSCADRVRNQVIEDALISMRGPHGVDSSIDRRCGVFFWTAKLNKDQVNVVRGMTGVEAVVTDTVTKSHSAAHNQYEGSPEGKIPYEKKVRNRKRTPSIIKHPGNYQHLNFVSASPATDVSNIDSYYYSSKGGQGSTVYVIEAGVETTHLEFTKNNVILGYLYALGSKEITPSPEPRTLHGTCGASLVAGATFGVAPRAGIIVVQVALRKGSVLDGLMQVIVDADDRRSRGDKIPGYTVVMLNISWAPDPSDPTEAALQKLLHTLLKELQIVLVFASGNDHSETNVDINEWPQMMASKGFPVINVGALNPLTGATERYSKGGRDLTIGGPSMVVCASYTGPNKFRHDQGTSFAGAVVSGLAAYFLALEGVGDSMRKSGNVPVAMKNYMLAKGFVKGTGTQKAVWNGAFPEDPGRWDPWFQPSQ